MDIKQFSFALSEISAYTDPDAYASDVALSSVFPDDADIIALAEELKTLFTAAHITVKDIRTSTGLSQAAFCALHGIPKRTIENWESGIATPPPYIPLMLAQLHGLAPQPERMV